MLHVGDGHGAQGDGEVSGTAIECAVRSTLTVDVATDRPVPTLHAETPSGRITFGLSPDLDEAAAQALEAMLTWIQAQHDVDRPTALALASACVDLRVTRIATPVRGVHAVLPPGALEWSHHPADPTATEERPPCSASTAIPSPPPSPRASRPVSCSARRSRGPRHPT